MANLKRLFSHELIALGFAERPSGHRYVWTFIRTRGAVSQRIDILRNPYDLKEMSVDFSTSIWPIAEHVGMLVDGPQWWRFRNGEEPESLATELLTIIRSRGIRYLELASSPIVPITDELSSNILSEAARVAAELHRRWHLPSDILSSLPLLEKRLLVAKQNNHESVPEILSQASAYFGEALRGAFGGTWTWDEKRRQPYLKGLDSRWTKDSYPVMIVTRYWALEDTIPSYSLLSLYNFLITGPSSST
jgi:hypothetical protein